MIKIIIGRILLIIAFIIVSPLIMLNWAEVLIWARRSEVIYASCKELLSLMPTHFGNSLRMAFYMTACRQISSGACFMYGSMVAHRETIIHSGAVVGTYSIVGCSEIGKNALIGARVSILSGKYQHGRPGERAGNQETSDEYRRILIGENSWIGEGSLILADVGKNCTVGAGSVVFKEVPDGSTVMGNPARKVNMNNQ